MVEEEKGEEEEEEEKAREMEEGEDIDFGLALQGGHKGLNYRMNHRHMWDCKPFA